MHVLLYLLIFNHSYREIKYSLIELNKLILYFEINMVVVNSKILFQE